MGKEQYLMLRLGDRGEGGERTILNAEVGGQGKEQYLMLRLGDRGKNNT